MVYPGVLRVQVEGSAALLLPRVPLDSEGERERPLVFIPQGIESLRYLCAYVE